MKIVLISFLCVLSGCVNVDKFAQSLNDRHVSSCITFTGLVGFSMGVHGVTATGGATILDCLEMR
jgi:hypothetical protein